MPKLLIRIATFFLIPALLVDPVLAAAPIPSISFISSHSTMLQSTYLFSEQALSGRAAEFINPLLGPMPKVLTIQLLLLGVGFIAAHFGHPLFGGAFQFAAILPAGKDPDGIRARAENILQGYVGFLVRALSTEFDMTHRSTLENLLGQVEALLKLLREGGDPGRILEAALALEQEINGLTSIVQIREAEKGEPARAQPVTEEKAVDANEETLRPGMTYHREDLVALRHVMDSTRNPVLVIKGKAGSGKSMLFTALLGGAIATRRLQSTRFIQGARLHDFYEAIVQGHSQAYLRANFETYVGMINPAQFERLIQDFAKKDLLDTLLGSSFQNFFDRYIQAVITTGSPPQAIVYLQDVANEPSPIIQKTKVYDRSYAVKTVEVQVREDGKRRLVFQEEASILKQQPQATPVAYVSREIEVVHGLMELLHHREQSDQVNSIVSRLYSDVRTLTMDDSDARHALAFLIENILNGKWEAWARSDLKAGETLEQAIERLLATQVDEIIRRAEEHNRQRRNRKQQPKAREIDFRGMIGTMSHGQLFRQLPNHWAFNWFRDWLAFSYGPRQEELKHRVDPHFDAIWEAIGEAMKMRLFWGFLQHLDLEDMAILMIDRLGGKTFLAENQAAFSAAHGGEILKIVYENGQRKEEWLKEGEPDYDNALHALNELTFDAIRAFIREVLAVRLQGDSARDRSRAKKLGLIAATKVHSRRNRVGPYLGITSDQADPDKIKDGSVVVYQAALWIKDAEAQEVLNGETKTVYFLHSIKDADLKVKVWGTRPGIVRIATAEELSAINQEKQPPSKKTTSTRPPPQQNRQADARQYFVQAMKQLSSHPTEIKQLDRDEKHNLIESDPQLGKDNPYGKTLTLLLRDEYVTPTSIELRNILGTIGPFIEKYAQLLSGEPELKLALFPRGSAKTGYASISSDLDYEIVILQSQMGRIPNEFCERLDNISERFLIAAGAKPDEAMPHVLSPFPVLNEQGELKQTYDMVGASALFLPLGYGDPTLLETGRTRAIQAILQNANARTIWNNIRAYVDKDTKIELDRVNEKPHLQKWLQMQNVGTEDEMRQFNLKRIKTMGLPSLNVMSSVYKKDAPHDEPKARGIDLHEGWIMFPLRFAPKTIGVTVVMSLLVQTLHLPYGSGLGLTMLAASITLVIEQGWFVPSWHFSGPSNPGTTILRQYATSA